MPDSAGDIRLDPVDYAVISQALTAAGREMGVKLIRSSYSNIVREAQDGSANTFAAKTINTGGRDRMNGRAAIKNDGFRVSRRPLNAWETYAQALLFSNEAAYVN